MTTELTTDQYQSTFGKSMIDVTETAEPVTDIWQFIEQLKNGNVVLKYVFEKELVYKVYRNSYNTFDHVLLPTENKNIFIVEEIDLNGKNIKGYYRLDLENEYGLK